jgi:hypothetical protein
VIPARRFIRNALILLSLLLCITSILMWQRSYRVADGVTHGRNGYALDGTLIRRIRGVESRNGRLHIGFGQFSSVMFNSVSPREEGFHTSHASPVLHEASGGEVWAFSGFQYKRWGQTTVLDIRSLAIPYWFLSVTFGLWPMFWLTSRVRRKRKFAHLCPTCGYDMRATPSRCPECGKPSPSAPLPTPSSSL